MPTSSGAGAGTEHREQLLTDELERAARAGALEEADRAVDRLRLGRRVGEQRALEMGERRMGRVAVPRRQLLDARACEAREVLGGSTERREARAARLVGKRDAHLGPRRERLEQRPLRARQVLEAVCEHRLSVPRIEIGPEAIDGDPLEELSVDETEAFELAAIRRIEPRDVALEIAGLEQPRLDLCDRLEERICEAAGLRRRREPVQRRRCDRTADDERALHVGQRPAPLSAGLRDPLEDVVERADRPGEERRPAREQLSLDEVDVRPVRHDEYGVAFERSQIAVEQQPDLARVCGPCDETQRHRSMVERGPDVSRSPNSDVPAKSGKRL